MEIVSPNIRSLNYFEVELIVANKEEEFEKRKEHTRDREGSEIPRQDYKNSFPAGL